MIAKRPSAKAQAAKLVRAAERGDVVRLRALIGAGVDVNEPCYDGYFALFSAAAKGRLAAVKLLLASGADLNLQFLAPEEEEGATALAMACRHGHQAVVEALLEAGARVNAPADDPDVPTPLQYAVSGKHLEIPAGKKRSHEPQTKSSA